MTWQLLRHSCFLHASSTPTFSIPALSPIPETTSELLKKTQQLHGKPLTHLLP
jgi:hypothetical protein